MKQSKQNMTRPKPKKSNRPRARNANRKPQNRAGQSARSAPAISECTSKYLAARLHAFSPKARGACVPRTPAAPSLKVSSFCRGTFKATGAGGVAGIKWKPAAFENNGGYLQVTSGTDPVTSWPGTFTGTFDGVSDVSQPGVPFNSTDYGAGDLECRLVGAAIRVKCTTANLDKGGTMVGYATPTGGVYTANNTVAQSMSIPTSKFKSADEDGWLTISQDLDDPALHDYNATGVWNASITSGTASMFVMCAPSNASNNEYTYECIAHWELKGRLVSPVATENQTDFVGFSTAMNAASRVARKLPPTPQSGEVSLAEGLGIMAKDLAESSGMNAVGHIAKNIGSAALRGLVPIG